MEQQRRDSQFRCHSNFVSHFTYYSGCIADIFQIIYLVSLTTLWIHYKICMKLQVDLAELEFLLKIINLFSSFHVFWHFLYVRGDVEVTVVRRWMFSGVRCRAVRFENGVVFVRIEFDRSKKNFKLKIRLMFEVNSFKKV